MLLSSKVVFFFIHLITFNIECSSEKPLFCIMKLESKDFLYDKFTGTLGWHLPGGSYVSILIRPIVKRMLLHQTRR